VQLEALDEELEKLSEKSSAIESDIEALQEKILEAGGVRLRTQKSKVDGIKEMIELGSERTTKAEVAKAKAEKDITKLEKAIATNTASLEGMEDELAELLESIRSRSATLESERSKVEEAQEAMEAKREAKDEVKSQLDSHAGSANAFRKLEVSDVGRRRAAPLLTRPHRWSSSRSSTTISARSLTTRSDCSTGRTSTSSCACTASSLISRRRRARRAARLPRLPRPLRTRPTALSVGQGTTPSLAPARRAARAQPMPRRAMTMWTKTWLCKSIRPTSCVASTRRASRPRSSCTKVSRQHICSAGSC
jgi:hypothetical protein